MAAAAAVSSNLTEGAWRANFNDQNMHIFAVTKLCAFSTAKPNLKRVTSLFVRGQHINNESSKQNLTTH
jgi:hypothetical protein